MCFKSIYGYEHFNFDTFWLEICKNDLSPNNLFQIKVFKQFYVCKIRIKNIPISLLDKTKLLC